LAETATIKPQFQKMWIKYNSGCYKLHIRAIFVTKTNIIALRSVNTKTRTMAICEMKTI